MFYATVLLAAPSFALAYLRGERFLALSVGASLLVLAVLVINERSGFVRSRRIRRPYDTRDKFNKLEVAVLFALLMGGLFVSVSAWLT